MNSTLTVSVITVNYNEREATSSLIKNLAGESEIAEIIVVDNSDVPEKAVPWSEQEEYRVIRSKNYGYAAALNQGVRNSTGDILLLINNDLFFPKGSFSCLLNTFLEMNSYAAISPVIAHATSGNIEYAGYTRINPWTGRNRAQTQTTGKKIRETSYLHGACMMTKRKIWDLAGGLPEIYFLYYEEMEWSQSIRNQGGKLGVAQQCLVRHTSSLSASRRHREAYYYRQRNRILFQRRQTTPLQRIIFMVYTLIISMPVAILRNFVSGRAAFSRDYLQAIHWNLTNPRK